MVWLSSRSSAVPLPPGPGVATVASTPLAHGPWATTTSRPARTNWHRGRPGAIGLFWSMTPIRAWGSFYIRIRCLPACASRRRTGCEAVVGRAAAEGGTGGPECLPSALPLSLLGAGSQSAAGAPCVQLLHDAKCDRQPPGRLPHPSRDRTGWWGVRRPRSCRVDFDPGERAHLLKDPDAHRALEALRSDLAQHAGVPPHDDAAILLLRRAGPPSWSRSQTCSRWRPPPRCGWWTG